MENEKIKELLQHRFDATPVYPKKRHIIFWYDAGGAFKDILDSLNLDNIKIISLTKSVNRKDEEIDTNIFRIKYILEVTDTESNYLIYSEYPRPEKDQENFLLDIEKYSEYFRADKSAMIVEEFGLDRLNHELLETVKAYEGFFGSKERKDKLARLLEGQNDINSDILKLGMLAVLSNTKILNIQEILKSIIADESRLEQIEKWMNLDYLYSQVKEAFDIETDSFSRFMKILMVVHFYREMREKPHTNLENYYTGKTNEIFLFADSLLQNKGTSEILLNRFYEIGKELNIRERIDQLELEKIIQGTGFEYFDKLAVKELADKLAHGLKEFDKYKRDIDIRLDNSQWKDKYICFYKGLLAALNLLRLRDNLVIKERENISQIFSDYTKEYYLVDRYYREFYYAYDQGKNSELQGVLDGLEQKISNIYEKEYLEVLLPEWSRHIENRRLLPLQKQFYNSHIKKSDTRVAVIISDALRYEIGSEITEKLLKEGNTKEVFLTGMVTELPSITSVGMANLLPHNEEIDFNPVERKVAVRRTASATTENRESILKLSEKESSAISYDDFKNMYRAEQEGYIKGKKVIYIYHDSIDATGDKGKTENRTFEACASAVTDIVGMAKTLASLGVVNVFITSDHGFLYERADIEEHDKLELKNSDYLSIGKRFALSADEKEEKGCISLKLSDCYGVFPVKNQRIKSAGSGLQFVHGGISPQEMIVPLIKYRSGTNATKSRKVNVRLKESIGKITSNLSKFSLYQLDPVSTAGKVTERDVRIALYTINGVRVSNEEKIRLNSIEENKLYTFRLTLSGKHDKVILKVIDLETDDILDSKEYDVNLSIASEFDF